MSSGTGGGPKEPWRLGNRGPGGLQASQPGSICPECGNSERVVGLHSRLRYDTEDGALHPGDMYRIPLHRDAEGRCDPENGSWENCSGRHLHVVLPNGHRWDVDHRAANCTLPEDGVHRCWVRQGEVPRITVDKDGVTCGAGGASVKSGEYHGYLVDGVLTEIGPGEPGSSGDPQT